MREFFPISDIHYFSKQNMLSMALSELILVMLYAEKVISRHAKLVAKWPVDLYRKLLYSCAKLILIVPSNEQNCTCNTGQPQITENWVENVFNYSKLIISLPSVLANGMMFEPEVQSLTFIVKQPRDFRNHDQLLKYQ